MLAVTAGLATALVLAACSGGSTVSTAGSARTINVIMVENGQMKDLATLVKDNFTKKTGIAVNFVLSDETDVRDKVTQDVATQAGHYDVVSVGAYEASIWAGKGWLHELSSYTDGDSSYDQNDLLAPMVASLTGDDGKLYAAPFYGESSMLMYRKDVLAAEGLTMPLHPTWAQVARIAGQVDGARPGMKGICLRGLAGWGEMFAPLTTVVNTFGGQWFSAGWKAQVDAKPFEKAVSFYVDLVRSHGESKPTETGFAQCLSALQSGKVAMWYDATSAAGLLEDSSSPVAGRMGYAFAPVEKTQNSGWLWNWALGVPAASPNAADAAAFVKWATSKDYEQLVGRTLGWSRVPSGKRASTYQIPEYKKASAAFGGIELKSIQTADPVRPGLKPAPAVGVQYVAIPEFADLATRISRNLGDALTGKASVRSVLAAGQNLAADVALIHRTSDS